MKFEARRKCDDKAPGDIIHTWETLELGRYIYRYVGHDRDLEDRIAYLRSNHMLHL